MKWTKWFCVSMACCLGLCVAGVAQAASSFMDPLTGYGGDSSQVGTIAALAAGGWDTADQAAGDRIVTYDANGAHFGTAILQDAGRNYQRTLDSDYATTNFIAKVTVLQTVVSGDQAFFGLGAGVIGLWDLPDVDSPNATTYMSPEENKMDTFVGDNAVNAWDGVTPAPALTFIRRNVMQMQLDSVAKQVYFQVDSYDPLNNFLGSYSHVRDVSSLYGANGWPTDPSKIYFGGDDGATFTNFMVVAGPNVPEPTAGVLVLLGMLGLGGRRRPSRRR